MTIDLLGLPLPRLADLLDEVGVGRCHAPRVFRGLHREGLPPDGFTDLGRHGATLAAIGHRSAARVVAAHEDAGTTKLVFELQDGARIESVLVPMHPGRLTLCVSTQVGCAMACTFCATGTLGLTRHLTAGEVVAQVHGARAHLGTSGRLTRLVFMGMGEPLHAYDTTRDAIQVLMNDHGLGMASKAITVSTVGLVPRMRRFAEDFGGRVQLALSLHAGTDATRQRIIPTAGASSLADLRSTLRDHPLPGSRYLMLEVVVLPGVNDSEAELDGIAAFAEGLDAMVNLIPFNPFAGAPFRSPEPDEVLAMYQGLRARGLVAKVRWPRGRGAHGACGQLALAHDRAVSSP